MMNATVVRWGVIALPLILLTPSCTASGTQAQSEFDRDQLLHDLRTLSHDSLEGRATGTRGNATARRYVAEAFEGAGLSPRGDSFLHPFNAGQDGDSIVGVNVIGSSPGVAFTDGPFLVVSAHFDHLGVRDAEIYNGADDNASGTAALMALARYFSDHPTRHPIIFAAFDAEEMGLQGARAFVSQSSFDHEDIAINVNLDMVSHSDSLLFAVGTHHYPALRPVIEAVPVPAGLAVRFGHDTPDLPESQNWTMASDHGPFHEAGIPFLYFGVEDHQDYHQPTDDYETINPRFYAAAVEFIRAVIQELDDSVEQWRHRLRGQNP